MVKDALLLLGVESGGGLWVLGDGNARNSERKRASMDVRGRVFYRG